MSTEFCPLCSRIGAHFSRYFSVSSDTYFVSFKMDHLQLEVDVLFDLSRPGDEVSPSKRNLGGRGPGGDGV